jgi:hypothetical protein
MAQTNSPGRPKKRPGDRHSGKRVVLYLPEEYGTKLERIRELMGQSNTVIGQRAIDAYLESAERKA